MNEVGINWPTLSKESAKKTRRKMKGVEETCKKIWALSMKNIDLNISKSILETKNWSKNYINALEEYSVEMYKSDHQLSRIADKGLEVLHETFVEINPSGETLCLKDILVNFAANSYQLETDFEFETVTIKGRHDLPSSEEIANNLQNQIESDSLETLVNNNLAEDDIISSYEHLLENLRSESNAIDDLRAKYLFVLMEFDRSISPLHSLLSFGFDVAMCFPEDPEYFIQLSDEAQRLSGSLFLPKAPSSTYAMGINLLTQYKEFISWVKKLGESQGKKLFICQQHPGNVKDPNSFRQVVAADVISKSLLDLDNENGFFTLSAATVPLPLTTSAVDFAESSFLSKAWNDRFLSKVFGPFKAKHFPSVQTEDCEDPKEPSYISTGFVQFEGHLAGFAKVLPVWRSVTCIHQNRPTFFCTMGPHLVENNKKLTSNYVSWQGLKARFPPFSFIDNFLAKKVSSALLLHEMLLFREKSTEERNVRSELLLNCIHGGLHRMPYDINSLGRALSLFGYF
eukprot:snap_masked-scaffold_25-processed-gene-4.34-mRNA-1 protein AED:1.00 eAED:1.00 QI:0/-1/0/0/-1/1/1/0/512